VAPDWVVELVAVVGFVGSEDLRGFPHK